MKIPCISTGFNQRMEKNYACSKSHQQADSCLPSARIRSTSIKLRLLGITHFVQFDFGVLFQYGANLSLDIGGYKALPSNVI